MHRRSVDMAALIAVLAIAALSTLVWFHRRPHDPIDALASRTKQGTPFQTFTLSDLNSRPVTYVPNGHPLFVILTAVGCSECGARVPVDRQAIAAAHKLNIPVWNILVYANQVSGKAFYAQFAPSEDQILCDPGGQVAVQQLRGSDNSCWIMLNAQGSVCWQGPGTVANIERALRTI